MPSDQQLVESFLSEFVSSLSQKHPVDIDFILLFGSAARGEWRKGVSDIDLIIQVTSGKNGIKRDAEKIFWELDSKLGTMFDEVCSIAKRDGMEDSLSRLESRTKLYVPFEVVGPGEIDWEKAKINSPLGFAADLMGPKSLLFLKMKTEGKILCGRDVRPLIPARAGFFERLKAVLIPQHLALLALLISPVMPKAALRRAFKAVLYSVDASLFFLGRPLGGAADKAISDLREELKGRVVVKYDFGQSKVERAFGYDLESNLDFSIVREALRLKYGFAQGSSRFGRRRACRFCLRSLLFVIRLNLFVYLKYKVGERFIKSSGHS